ncbi:helix-turn-helix transcriptional regulator [Roseobacter sinensis]|uniref:Helix-turn-helix transcriptional regulator n=1 Tax=Roseobacter sinensis TaxID=2931391 RepID=A0ABT3BBA9_9RHOB|nr:helix-turn-helix transcriptional regulator [Roseobacter sp. WL0113]MCV3270699.1 helix-turn-helix transcriptional regulator [Roseobacter sp. WL0113]
MDIATQSAELETWRLALAVGVLMVSAFCAHLLLLPGPNRSVRLPLGVFFLSNTARLVALPVEHLTLGNPMPLMSLALDLAEVPLSTVQPMLLWLYVRRLTADPTRPDAPMRTRLHAAPVVYAVVTYVFVLAQQAGVSAGLDVAVQLQPVTIGLLWSVTLLFYALVPLYAGLTVRRLLAYRTRLKDLYASTEGRELRWIWALTAVVALFWGVNLISILLEAAGTAKAMLTPAVSFFAGALAQIALLWTIAIWGVRQQPGMMPKRPVAVEKRAPTKTVRKYGHAAQDGAHLARIAGKIDKSMAEGRLYRDPELSLWDLAERVGARRHYVSQALNERLGQNFFDYVNGFRIEEAKRQLAETEGSILSITYDVGFNSRSVFYRAFKQKVGMTPSEYRQSATADDRQPARA